MTNRLTTKLAVPLPILRACVAMVLPCTRAADSLRCISPRSVSPRRFRMSVAHVGRALMTAE